MRSSNPLFTAFTAVTLLQTAAAWAARVDMNDPRRALGREDDVRIDAQLMQDTVSSGAAVGITYRIENLTSAPIAVADKVCDVSFDPDELAVVVSIGSEVPHGGEMPRLVVVPSGESRTLTAGGMLRVLVPSGRARVIAVPRQVQIKVNILRNLAPFQALIARQASGTVPIALSDEQFEKWIESNDTIFLNTIPVHYDASKGASATAADASHRGAGDGF